MFPRLPDELDAATSTGCASHCSLGRGLPDASRATLMLLLMGVGENKLRTVRLFWNIKACIACSLLLHWLGVRIKLRTRMACSTWQSLDADPSK